jgi:hypothetical protein
MNLRLKTNKTFNHGWTQMNTDGEGKLATKERKEHRDGREFWTGGGMDRNRIRKGEHKPQLNADGKKGYDVTTLNRYNKGRHWSGCPTVHGQVGRATQGGKSQASSFGKNDG